MQLGDLMLFVISNNSIEDFVSIVKAVWKIVIFYCWKNGNFL